MTLRKRNTKSPMEPHKQKNVKPSEEDDQEESSSVAAVCLKTDQLTSASFLRYEIVEKKGQRILVPVRYSIRNQNLDVSFHAKEALQAVYQPSEMESLFCMNDTAQQTAMLLRSKLAPKLQPNDFEKVLKVYDHFVLVKLNKNGSKRFGGAE